MILTLVLFPILGKALVGSLAMVKTAQISSSSPKFIEFFVFNREEIIYFRHRLINWYIQNRRPLPWRGDTIDGEIPPAISPYGVWISEIMAQQTRIATVIPYWNRWMKTYPTVHELAASTEEEVNKLWAGLGYYRRARQLLAGAKEVVNKFNGQIPFEIDDLLKIPGIGPYTAGAISSIAFNKPNSLVDGNVIRVLSRLRAVPYEIGTKQLESLMWKIAADIVDPDRPGDFNQGLMELGATICTPTSPACGLCSVQSICRAKKIVDRNKALVGSVTNHVSALLRRTNEASQTAVVDLISDDGSLSENGMESVSIQAIHNVTKTNAEVVGTTVTNSVAGSVDMEDLFLNRILKQLDTSTTTTTNTDIETDLGISINYRTITEVGYFPLRPSRKRPRDIILSVCVLRTVINSNSNTNSDTNSNADSTTNNSDNVKYLFVRRPETGLLAKQWEFPNIILHEETDSTTFNVTTKSSSKSKSSKSNTNKTVLSIEEEDSENISIGGPASVPVGDTMKFTSTEKWNGFPDYFNSKLGLLWQPLDTVSHQTECSFSDSDRDSRYYVRELVLRPELGITADDTKITHIFSHQRHIMHITIKDVQVSPISPSITSDDIAVMSEDENDEKRIEYAWKSGAELKSDGITSGCEKILDYVESLHSNSTKVQKIATKKSSKTELSSSSVSSSSKQKKSKDTHAIATKGAIDSFFTKTKLAKVEPTTNSSSNSIADNKGDESPQSKSPNDKNLKRRKIETIISIDDDEE